MRQRMGHGAPGIDFEKIEDDIDAILRWNIETTRDGLVERGQVAILLVALERDDGDRHRHFQLVLENQLAKNRAHLFQPQCNFAAALVAGISDYREMGGMHFKPSGLVLMEGGRRCPHKRGKETEQHGSPGRAFLDRREPVVWHDGPGSFSEMLAWRPHWTKQRE